MTRLTFSENAYGRSYWLADPATGKKRRVPSVSALKSTVHQFNGEHWHLTMAAAAAADMWDDLAAAAPTSREAMILAAAQRRVARPREFGTAVHHYAEHLWTGDPVEVPEDYVTHVKAIAEWWTGQRVTLIHAERMVFSDADEFDGGPYAGRFDLIVDHPEMGRVLLDLKTWMPGSSGTPRPAEWAFQLAAYASADYMVSLDGDDVAMPRIDTCAVLHVGPGGAAFHVLPDRARRLAEDQVKCARALKSLPMPKMVERVA